MKHSRPGRRRGSRSNAEAAQPEAAATGTKGARWLLLKRPENLTDQQAVKLQEILRYHLRSVRSHVMKEDFQRFWEYLNPTWAGKFLDAWCSRALRSKIDPMKKVARMLRGKRELVLNWFRTEGSSRPGSWRGSTTSSN